MKRFNLRHLLFAAALLAMVFAVYPRVSRYVRWYETRKALVQWESKLTRKTGKFECYNSIKLDARISPAATNLTRTAFIVSTSKPKKTVNADGSVDWDYDSNVTIDPERFFVIPPEKWVDSIDAVIEAWDNYAPLAARQ